MSCGRLTTEGLPGDIVYAGFSLGVLPAQALAQTRPGAKGALLFHACVQPSEFAGPWPPDIPLQTHGMDGDELFADASLPAYDHEAATPLKQRVVTFLDKL